MRAAAPRNYFGRVICVAAMIGLLVSHGCSSKTFTEGYNATTQPSDSQQAPDGNPNRSASSAPASSAEIKLIVADEKQFQELVDGHRGKVVLVDFWATWCLTCVEHFPETVKLHNEHAADGLAAVTVSFDSLDDRAAVEDYLREAEAGKLDNLLSKYDGVGTEVPKAFDFEGVLPHYRLYDRTGKLRYRWDEPPADLNEKVAELLAETVSE